MILEKITQNFKQIPPLSVIAIFFIAGILIASFINIPFFVLFGLCLLLLTAAFLSIRHGLIFSTLFLLFSLTLGALHTSNFLQLSDNDIGSIDARNLNQCSLRGIVDSDPTYGKNKISFISTVKSIMADNKSLPVKGKILVNVFRPIKAAQKQAEFSYGEEFILEGEFHKPFDFGGETNFSYRDYLRNQGIYYIFNVRKKDKIVSLGSRNTNALKSFAFKLEKRFEDIFIRYLWPQNSQFLSALILGQRQNLPEETREIFVRTGTSHIIAISGFNVGIIVFIILIFLKAIGIKRRLRYIITIPLLLIHMYAVGLSPSVVRATIMAIILLFGYLINRESHLTNSLSLSALIILAYNPLQIFDIGFQLSFVSVLGIVTLSPKLIDFFKARRKPNFLQTVMLNSFAVSLSAWIATFGFIAYYFRIITPITLLANLLIVPYSSLIIILGFTLSLSAAVSPLLAPLVAATTNFSLGLLFKITYFLSGLPFAYFYL